MPIICFEGASAVGKSAASEILRARFGAAIVAEANILFPRSQMEPKFWYYERQCERWRMAVDAAARFEIVVLDGDPFQPVWYNWVYGDDSGASFIETMDFYRDALAAGAIDFPDKYFILTASADELASRKRSDETRARKNFARHLRFVEPQKAFFRFLESRRRDSVEFIENADAAATARLVAARSIETNAAPRRDKVSSLQLFDAAREWLAANEAANFANAF